MEDNALSPFDLAVSAAAEEIRSRYDVLQDTSIGGLFEREFGCTIIQNSSGFVEAIVFPTANDRLLFQLRWTK